jgi:ubiquinone/menaquinone biosynthesis C-methylase UbiE
VLKASAKINYVSGDLNPLVADRKIDITDISFENDYFDFIICNHVLEHIQDDRKAMNELFRVLKPSGEAVLQVPISKYNKKTFEDVTIIDPEGREKYFGQKDHVRIYGKDYKERLESVGFKVELYDIKNELNIKNIRKYGFNKDEILYISKK